MPLRHTTNRRAAIAIMAGLLCLACCPAWPPGAEGVRIADQEVLVVWDSAEKTEHFVRRANFSPSSSTAPKDFGFLVPTPTPPRLTETPDEIFVRLANAIKPEVRVETRLRLAPVPLVALPFLIGGCSKMAMEDTVAGSVEVLGTAFVGGFEAAILRANEVESLLAWLKDHGYDARAELKEWLEPYIGKGWIVTAFKFDTEGQKRSISTAAVCLSFATDEPFFPYRVPSDQLAPPEKGSLLRVYFAGDQRVTGDFEDTSKAWPAKTKYSGPVGNAAALLAGVGGEEPTMVRPDRTWLTAFEDRTWPGGTEDLYFHPSADPSPVIPPPIIRVNYYDFWLPPDVILAVIAVAFLVWRRRSRRRSLEAA